MYIKYIIYITITYLNTVKDRDKIEVKKFENHGARLNSTAASLLLQQFNSPSSARG